MSRLLKNSPKEKSLLCLRSQISAFRKVTPKNSSAVIALEYVHNQTPKVVRRGTKDSGMEILRDARRYGIPIVTDADLLEGLQPIFLQEEIPEELFEPVAKHLLELKLV